jgi:hypothetical protein
MERVGPTRPLTRHRIAEPHTGKHAFDPIALAYLC